MPVAVLQRKPISIIDLGHFVLWIKQICARYVTVVDCHVRKGRGERWEYWIKSKLGAGLGVHLREETNLDAQVTARIAIFLMPGKGSAQYGAWRVDAWGSRNWLKDLQCAQLGNAFTHQTCIRDHIAIKVHPNTVCLHTFHTVTHKP